ncbi:MAG: FMN-binding protein [Candidatus Paceibacterota bacterium]
MKKVFVSLLLIALIVAYVWYQTFVVSVPRESENAAATTAPLVPTPASSPVVPAAVGRYRDGVYVGDAVDAFYGIVQVQVTVSGGALTAIALLRVPDDRERTIAISNSSLPILKQEAIKAQSAQVDIVSGATQTSEGFIASLASALGQARR